jgi:hypothetical protein
VADRRPSSPSRFAAVVVVVGLLAAAVIANAAGGDSPRRAGTAPVDVSIPARDTAVADWYCAEGTSAPNGRADEILYLSNIDDRLAHARVTVMAGEQGGTRTLPVDVPARTLVPVRVADVLAAAEPGVLVESSGGRVVVAHGVTGNGDVAIGPCASSPSPHWSFAAGNTGRGAQLWLALFNPSTDDAIVDVSFVTDSGPLAPGDLQGIVVPRASRVSIPVHEQAARRILVGTQVRARRGQVVAEQSLSLDGTDGRKGLAVSLGASELGRHWEVPTGLIGPGRTQQVVVANPGENPVDATIQVRLDANAELAPQQVTVDPGTARNVDLGPVPPGVGFSTSVRATGPVAVETLAATTAPYAAAVRGLATAVGQPAGARQWVLAPARASDRSVDFVDVVNPGRRAVSVTVAVLADGQRRVVADLEGTRIEGGRRAVLDLGAHGVPVGATLVVQADGPVVVDREASSVPGLTLAAAIPDRDRP